MQFGNRMNVSFSLCKALGFILECGHTPRDDIGASLGTGGNLRFWVFFLIVHIVILKDNCTWGFLEAIPDCLESEGLSLPMRKGWGHCLHDYPHSCVPRSWQELAGRLYSRARNAAHVLALLGSTRGQAAWVETQRGQDRPRHSALLSVAWQGGE